MIADFARVANGKLDVIGGGWSMMNAQGPFGFFVAALFQIPWDQTNAKHRFRLELLDADGQGVPIPSGETVRAEGEFEVGRPAGLRPGTPVDAPLVVTAHGRDVRNVGWLPGIRAATRFVARRAAAIASPICGGAAAGCSARSTAGSTPSCATMPPMRSRAWWSGWRAANRSILP